MNVTHLCDQILDMQDYRAQLYDYLKNRMYAVAPNLTVLVGELIGARLISHAGMCNKLINKSPYIIQCRKLGRLVALLHVFMSKKSQKALGMTLCN